MSCWPDAWTQLAWAAAATGTPTDPMTIAKHKIERCMLPCWRTHTSRESVDVHRLPLGEELARRLALLTRPARALLHAAKRHVELDTGTFLVDLDHAGVDVVGKAQRTGQVVRKDTRGQPIARVVGQPNGVVVCSGRQEGRDRPENLLADHAAICAETREYRRLDEVAIAQLLGAPTAGQDTPTFPSRDVQIVADGVQLGL